MRVALILMAAAFPAAACTAVDGDRITGRDLARADARFEAVPADYVAGFSPAPGIQRTIEVRELMRIAGAHALELEGYRPLCFERRSEALTEPRLKAALEPLLPPNAALAIMDFSRGLVPVGDLKFAWSDLGRPSSSDPLAPVLWRGRVIYGSGGSVPVWAKVSVLVEETWVETVRTIPAGQPIAAADVTVRHEKRFPFGTPPISSIEAAAGKSATRALPKGQILTANLLTAAPDIIRGDAVTVEVASGAVRLRFAAKALNSGRVKDFVLIESDAGRKLRAQVQNKGEVLIDAERK